MFSVLQEPFAKSLKTADRVALKKHPVFALTHVLLCAADNNLWIAASNLEQSLQLRIDATVNEPFSVALESTFLATHIGEYPKNPIDVTFDSTRNIATFKSGKSEAPIGGISSDQFPSFNKPDGDPVLTIACADLVRLISQSAFAASEDVATRPVLSGVFVEADGDVLRMSAIDGFVVARVEHKLTTPATMSVIIPAKALAMIGGTFAQDAEISVYVSNAQVFFATPDVIFSTRRIDGQFPDLMRAIPFGTDCEAVEVDRLSLLSVVKTAASFGTQESDTLRIAADGDSLICKTRQYEGRRYETAIETVTTNDGDPVAWNGQIALLRDTLNAMLTPTVILEMRGEKNILILKEPGNEHAIWGIMPVTK